MGEGKKTDRHTLGKSTNRLDSTFIFYVYTYKWPYVTDSLLALRVCVFLFEFEFADSL